MDIKKQIAALSAFVLGISALCGSIAAPLTAKADSESVCAAFGDINGDEAVDTSDAYCVLVYYALKASQGKAPEWEEIINPRVDRDATDYGGVYGDLDGNQSVDLADAQAILSYYAEFSAEGGEVDWTHIIGREVPGKTVTTEPVVETTTSTTTTTQTTTQTTTVTTTTTAAATVAAPAKVISGSAALDSIINNGAGARRNGYTIYDRQTAPDALCQNVTLSDSDIATLEAFAASHFTPGMTNVEKLYITHQWIHNNVTYASGSLYYQIWNYSYVNAIFNHSMGQCLQYNGAMAAMLAYLGYDVYMIKGWTSGQHFWTEVRIGGKTYLVECGNEGECGSWQHFFKEITSDPTGHYPG